jgi:5-methylcytosine-specific restriction endonuclease McrA
MYSTARWRSERLLQLAAHPICFFVDDPRARDECERIACVVDHVTPINAGGEKWDRNNFRSLCPVCNAKVTSNYRRTGRNELP